MAELERTAIGSPYRPLDTKSHAVQADRTYDVLSGLAALAGGTYKVYKQEHAKEMTRRAKNDLVNNTINPDLQEQEIAYANTVAKGQALNSFQDLKSRMNSGEFDEMDPEKFQGFINAEHKATTNGYSTSKYYESATSTYNDFWVNNEATLSAGHAGRYRGVLKGKQQNSLSEQLISMARAKTFTTQDIINEITSPDYSLLDHKDRMDTALIAGGLLASTGDSKLLSDFNDEFDFASDPERYKLYQASMKTADKIHRTQSTEDSLRLYQAFIKKRDEGTLIPEDYNVLKGKLKPNGEQIVSITKFSEALAKGYSKRITASHINSGVTGMTNEIDLTATHSDKEFNEVATIVFNDIMSKEIDSLDKMAILGTKIVAQKRPIKEVTSMAQKWGTTQLYLGNDINPLAQQGFTQWKAMRSAMNNDKLFYKQLGPGADRFKYIDSTAKFTEGTEQEKATAGIESARTIEDTIAKGIQRKHTVITDDQIKVRDKGLETALEGDDTWFGWDSNELDEAVAEAREYINQKYFENVNLKLHDPEAAMELAIDQVMSTVKLIDGSLVNTRGIDTGVNDYGTFIESFKENKIISEALPEGWDNYKVKVSVDDQAYLIVDKQNNIQHTVGFKDAIALINSENLGIYDGVDYDSIFTKDYAKTTEGRERQSLELDNNDAFYKDVLKLDEFKDLPGLPEWATMNHADRMRIRTKFYKDYENDMKEAFHVVNQLKLKEAVVPEFELSRQPDFTFDESLYDPFAVEADDILFGRGIKAPEISTNRAVSSPANKFKSLISKGEGTGQNYNTTVRYGKDAPKGFNGNLTNKTLQEVYDLGIEFRKNEQKRTGRISGKTSSAMGRWQITGQNMKQMAKELKLPMSTKFTAEVQDQMLTQILMKKRGLQKYIDGSKTQAKMITDIAKEFASFPKDKSGNSYYGNKTKAKVSYKDVVALLDSLKEK